MLLLLLRLELLQGCTSCQAGCTLCCPRLLSKLCYLEPTQHCSASPTGSACCAGLLSRLCRPELNTIITASQAA